jgi:hypothetical protein
MYSRLSPSLLIVAATISVAAEPPKGDSVIRARAGRSEIVITTTNRLAGAIHSLTWNGKEFIDSTDHGRQLQSAANFDCGKDLIAETYNPTEAGSRADGVSDKSSSRLQRIRPRGAELETTVQMAFWLRPGEKSEGHPALNKEVLSDHLISKRVHIGHRSLPHAIEYDVTFTVPKGEKHTAAVFEAVTGYMPAEFRRFWKYDAGRGELKPLSDRPGEQSYPVVLATESGAHAMGVYSPDQPSRGFEEVGYGRFRFKTEKVVKWNCVFRVSEPKGIKPGDYRFRTFVIVGSLEDVRATLKALHQEYKHP